MANRPPSLKMEAFDMDSLFDFNQSTTQPSSASLTATPSTAVSPYDKEQERQQFNGPSHDYNLHKQQVGLPVGSMASMPAHGGYDGYGSGMGGDMGGFGWSSGIDFDTDMNMDFNSPQSAMPAMFFPTPSNESPSDAFIDPSNIGGPEEPTSNVGRLWPGMHSQQAQQAAMQKAAQTQVMQQRQMKLQAQHAQYRQVGNTVPNHPPQQQQQQQGHAHGHAKRPSHASEPHVEESISRLLSQMRQNSNASVDDDEGSPNSMLPHIARMKKDEEEMDEDERLLASEEGKKLSSKERRQLRNKVSARAFRSRRKEYIGQLEGEVAIKAQENTDLRSQNSALLQENDRYRTLIETLLRHPAFTPFINDISKDPSVLGPSQQQQQQQQQAPQHQQQAPQQQQQQQQQQQPPQDSKPDFMNFDASQLQIPNMQQPQQQQQNERVGLAMIPENDFSKLRLSGFNNHSANYSNAYNVNAYPILEVPEGPNPADLLAQSTSDMSDMLAQLDGAARKVRWAEMAGH